jgi:hypothetical protein
MLTFPVTNVCCERSLSSLRRLKTWERATMSEERLCDLVMLHVHRNMNVSSTANISYGECQHNYEDTPNIGVKVFMRVTQRLLERNRDVFKPIMEFHSPSGSSSLSCRLSFEQICLIFSYNMETRNNQRENEIPWWVWKHPYFSPVISELRAWRLLPQY